MTADAYLPDLLLAKEKYTQELAKTKLLQQREKSDLAVMLSELPTFENWHEQLADILFEKGISQSDMERITERLEEQNRNEEQGRSMDFQSM